MFNVVIIGAGITGATLAERLAAIGKKVLIIEKRNHIGGNCFDYYDGSGILVPKYGPHFFHTDNERVWNYVGRFTDWHPYEHRVLAYVDKKFVPVPVNINTVNLVCGENIKNELEMKIWLKNNTEKIASPTNSEELALSRVGKKLYEKIFKGYTEKQWDKKAKDLSPSVIGRIPVKTNFDDRYFSDRYQAMPKDGYTTIFKNMLKSKNIVVRLKTDFLKIRNRIKKHQLFIFTGPIDRYFGYRFGPLEYRSLKFRYQTLDKEFYQSKAQINYPNDNKFTRITEPKHSTGQKSPITTIIREYHVWGNTPYYPVPSQKNHKIYREYEKEALRLEEKGIYFAGRLANYKYFNMDQAFKNALDLFDKINIKI